MGDRNLQTATESTESSTASDTDAEHSTAIVPEQVEAEPEYIEGESAASSTSAVNSDCLETILNLREISNRKYIDATLGPILLFGLYELDLHRPPDPISYLACFLLKNKDRALKIEEPEKAEAVTTEYETVSEEYENSSDEGTHMKSHGCSKLDLS